MKGLEAVIKGKSINLQPFSGSKLVQLNPLEEYNYEATIIRQNNKELNNLSTNTIIARTCQEVNIEKIFFYLYFHVSRNLQTRSYYRSV